ncbi:MAG TPA: universal stress protein, partial [Gammaproteobacteria bacterium]
AEWARRTRAQMRIVHVTPPKRWVSGAWGIDTSAVDAIQSYATNALKQAAERADPRRSIELSTGVLSGAAAKCIARAALDYRADLLVVGARGERSDSGERVLGGTSSKLLAAAGAPLLLVRRTRMDPVAGVVAALDLSSHSRTVLEWADLASADQHLYAYHVYDVPFAARLETYGLSANLIDVYSTQARSQREADLAALVASIGRAGVTSRMVERGEPLVLLRRYIESVRPSLVVLGKGIAGKRSSSSNVGGICRFIAGVVSADVLVV